MSDSQSTDFEPAGPYKHKSGSKKRKQKQKEEANDAKLAKQSEVFFARFKQAHPRTGTAALPGKLAEN